jgi:hypothetical protein
MVQCQSTLHPTFVWGLWRVRVGNRPATGDWGDVHEKVTGFGPVPFAGKTIDAFEITSDYNTNKGEQAYRFVDYWGKRGETPGKPVSITEERPGALPLHPGGGTAARPPKICYK